MYTSYTYTVYSDMIVGPSSVTYLPGLTPLPILLTCNVAGIATWTVNDTDYTLANLTDGELPAHSLDGTNLLILSPVNNTEYICVSQTNDGKTRSDPAYIVIAGKYNDNLGVIHNFRRLCEHTKSTLFANPLLPTSKCTLKNVYVT